MARNTEADDEATFENGDRVRFVYAKDEAGEYTETFYGDVIDAGVDKVELSTSSSLIGRTVRINFDTGRVTEYGGRRLGRLIEAVKA